MPEALAPARRRQEVRRRKVLVPAMTRYSRSVIPGRPNEDRPSEAGDSASLQRVIFGSRKQAVQPMTNARENDYPAPMEMDVDEAGFLVDRSSQDRRGANGDRRKKTERRHAATRRQSEFKPLREDGAAYRTNDSGSRGPILLVGALAIVAVFGVVVWNAYREGVRTDDATDVTPKLAAAGAFKTPPRETTSVAASQPAAAFEPLDGAPSPVVTKPPEVRAEPKPAAPVQTAVAAPAPAPSKATAPPPAPLKQSVAPPVVAAAKPATPVATKAAAASTPVPAPAKVDLPKPAATAAVAPAPVAATPVPADAYKPVFAAGGSWLVQVAAPSTEAGAVSEWNKRVSALPDFFAAAEKVIVQADVNGKTVYRLRAGSFGSKADADAFCSAYKAKGGNCFPATR
ncbi:MAG: SPOR domain-containing protein [Hyphomonadaceae bacterium]